MILVVLYKDERPEGMGPIEEFAEVRYAKSDELATVIVGADALLLWDYFSTAVEDVWQVAQSLKWIHVAAAGVDKLLFDELRNSDVVLTNSRGVFDRPIAEFVLASVLAMAKDMPGSYRRQQLALWEHRETDSIEGARALIVGTGSIGRETARLLVAVGASIAGVGRTDRSSDELFGVVHSSSNLVKVVKDFDYVILCAPLVDSTRNLVNASVFNAMKPSARLINVGRGELLDEDALIHALNTGNIAGAALDVFSVEPLPTQHPLWAMDNVLISAHLSGDTTGWRERLFMVFEENVHRYVGHQKMLNIVDKELGFVPSPEAGGSTS